MEVKITDRKTGKVYSSKEYVMDSKTGKLYSLIELETIHKEASKTGKTVMNGAHHLMANAVVEDGVVINYDPVTGLFTPMKEEEKKTLDVPLLNSFISEHSYNNINVKEEPVKKEDKAEEAKPVKKSFPSYEEYMKKYMEEHLPKKEEAPAPEITEEDVLENADEQESLQYIAKNLTRNSVSNGKKVSVDYKTRFKDVARKVLTYGAVAFVSISSFTIGTKVVRNGVNQYRYYEVKDEISRMLNGPWDQSVKDIVDRNTHVTDDFQGFWYDNTKIAEDLLTLPDNLFDAAFYEVYIEMGNNRSNNYIDNFDSVIYSLSRLSKEGSLAYIRTHKDDGTPCKTMDEYLENNMFMAEGKPDTKKFIETSIIVTDNCYTTLCQDQAKTSGGRN